MRRSPVLEYELRNKVHLMDTRMDLQARKLACSAINYAVCAKGSCRQLEPYRLTIFHGTKLLWDC